MNTDNTALQERRFAFWTVRLHQFIPSRHLQRIDELVASPTEINRRSRSGISARFAGDLASASRSQPERVVQLANEAISASTLRFQEHWLAGMRDKLGLSTNEEGDLDLTHALLRAMRAPPEGGRCGSRPNSRVSRRQQAMGSTCLEGGIEAVCRTTTGIHPELPTGRMRHEPGAVPSPCWEEYVPLDPNTCRDRRSQYRRMRGCDLLGRAGARVALIERNRDPAGTRSSALTTSVRRQVI